MERVNSVVKPDCKIYSVDLPPLLIKSLAPIISCLKKQGLTALKPLFVLFGSANRTIVASNYPNSLPVIDFRTLQSTCNFYPPRTPKHSNSSNIDIMTSYPFLLALHQQHPTAPILSSRCHPRRQYFRIDNGAEKPPIDVHAYSDGEHDLVALAAEQNRFLIDMVVVAFYTNGRFLLHDPNNLLATRPPHSEIRHKILAYLLLKNLKNKKNPNLYYPARKIIEIILFNPHLFHHPSQTLIAIINSFFTSIDRLPTLQEAASICALLHKRFLYPDWSHLITIARVSPSLAKLLISAAQIADDNSLLEYLLSLGFN